MVFGRLEAIMTHLALLCIMLLMTLLNPTTYLPVRRASGSCTERPACLLTRLDIKGVVFSGKFCGENFVKIFKTEHAIVYFCS